MNGKILLVLFLIVVSCAHTQQEQIYYPEETTTELERLDNGDAVLKHQIALNSPVDRAWEKFTTTEGLQEFMAPVVNADFRVGGIIETSPKPNAEIGDEDNVRHSIIGYIPKQMLVYKIVNVPEQFPHPELVKQLRTIVTFDEIDSNRTLATERMYGWGEGEDWDTVRECFIPINKFTFNQFKRSLEIGPRDWTRKD